MSPLYLVTIKTSALQSNLMVVPARACTFQLRQMTHTKTSKAAKKEAGSQGGARGSGILRCPNADYNV